MVGVPCLANEAKSISWAVFNYGMLYSFQLWRRSKFTPWGGSEDCSELYVVWVTRYRPQFHILLCQGGFQLSRAAQVSPEH